MWSGIHSVADPWRDLQATNNGCERRANGDSLVIQTSGDCLSRHADGLRCPKWRDSYASVGAGCWRISVSDHGHLPCERLFSGTQAFYFKSCLSICVHSSGNAPESSQNSPIVCTLV